MAFDIVEHSGLNCGAFVKNIGAVKATSVIIAAIEDEIADSDFIGCAGIDGFSIDENAFAEAVVFPVCHVSVTVDIFRIFAIGLDFVLDSGDLSDSVFERGRDFECADDVCAGEFDEVDVIIERHECIEQFEVDGASRHIDAEAARILDGDVGFRIMSAHGVCDEISESAFTGKGMFDNFVHAANDGASILRHFAFVFVHDIDAGLTWCERDAADIDGFDRGALLTAGVVVGLVIKDVFFDGAGIDVEAITVAQECHRCDFAAGGKGLNDGNTVFNGNEAFVRVSGQDEVDVA